MSLVSIPFDSGMNEGIEQALLPQGVFREVRNMRLSRDGKLVPRPQFAAFTMTETSAGGNIDAIDLWTYRDQLITAGNNSSFAGLTNAWVYSDRTACKWHQVDTSGLGNTPQLPLVTDVRDLPRPLPAAAGAAQASVAAGGGYVCTVWHETTSSKGYVLVQRASDGAQILYRALPTTANDGYILPRVIYVNTSFIIAAADADDDVRVYSFRPDADKDLPNDSTILSGAALTSFEIAPIRNHSSGFVVVSSNSTPTLQIIGGTVDAAGTITINGLFAATTVDAVTTYSDVTICADNTAGVFVAARVAATGLVTAWTYTLAGVLSVGPTTDVFDVVADGLTGGEMLGSAVCDLSSTNTCAVLVTNHISALGTPFIRIDPTRFDTHAELFQSDWYTSRYVSGPFAVQSVSSTSTALVTLGVDLEGFNADTTTATSSRAFLSGSNALMTVHLSNSGNIETIAAVVDQGLAGRQPLTATTDAGTVRTQPGNIVRDASTGKCYWARLVADVFEMTMNDSASANAQPVVAEFSFAGETRRQVAELDNQLFIAGGLPLLYSGAPLFVEPSFETPQIFSITPSNGAGTLTNNGVYSWVVVFRWVDGQGRVHVSPPSKPISSTFGAADDTASLIVQAPHTRRQESDIGSTAVIELYRTQNGGATFRLVERNSYSFAGERLAIVDTSPDTAIASNPILYTQSQTPVAHHMAPPCKYVVPARSRVVVGGTNDETEVVFSKLVFPGEPIEFAPPGLLGYRKSIGEPVTALMGLDEQVLVASSRSIYRIGGAGPDHSGQGEFLDPERIPGLGGVSDWRSVVEVPTGYFFQSSDTKLYFVDRSGAVSWVQGQAVRDTLATFPTITAATYAREQNCVFFACRNSQASDGVMLVFDLRRECWYVDSDSTVLAGTVTAAVDYQKRLTVASNTNVYQESPGTYNTDTNRVVTGNIRNGSLCSWNHLRRIGVRGSGLGVSSPTPRIDMYIDVENGSGFTLIDQHTVSSSGNFIKFWRVPNQKVDSFKLQIDSIGVALNELVLDIEPRRGVSRRNPSDLK